MLVCYIYIGIVCIGYIPFIYIYINTQARIQVGPRVQLTPVQNIFKKYFFFTRSCTIYLKVLRLFSSSIKHQNENHDCILYHTSVINSLKYITAIVRSTVTSNYMLLIFVCKALMLGVKYTIILYSAKVQIYIYKLAWTRLIPLCI